MASSSDPRVFSDGGERHLVLAERLRQAERRAATSRVASALGHLIGTPLNVIAGRAALIRSSLETGEFAEHARRIEQQVERLSVEIRRFIDYLTPLDTTQETATAANVVDDALLLCRPIATERGMVIEAAPHCSLEEPVERMSTLLVLTTLISLAVRSTPVGQRLRLRVFGDAPQLLRFEIDAPDIKYPEGRIDRLEPPRQASDDDSEAMVVLSISYAVAHRRGGDVRMGRGEAGGTTISFTCPLAS